MKQLNWWLPLAALLITFTSCNDTNKPIKTLKQTDFPAPPIAEVRPDTFVNFGQTRIDNYFWLKDKNDPKVIDYLQAENRYTDTVMASTKELQETIYNEVVGRIKEDDESYPSFSDGYYYYSRTEKGKQYRTYCRRKGSMEAPEEILFDLNTMAEGKTAFIFGGYSVSPDNSKVAYLFNETGSYAEFVMKIKDQESGEEIGFTVIGAASIAWANDNNTLFYSTIDETLRSNRIYRQALDEREATLVYEESDTRFSTYVSGSKTKEYIFIGSASSTTSEERFIPADKPLDAFTLFLPREQGVEYAVYDHKDHFFVRYKDKEKLNGMIYEVPLDAHANKAQWKELIPHRDDARIEGIDVLKDYLLVERRINGLSEISITPLAGEEATTISFPEPVYTASLSGNPEYDATTFRYSYTSLNRPTTLFEYDITSGETAKLKEQEIPSGFNPDDYVVERLWADAPDGVKVPMAIVYRKGLKRDGS
ncbi:MAG: oligopeptidase B, partial [Proteiniphilum sp.]